MCMNLHELLQSQGFRLLPNLMQVNQNWSMARLCLTWVRWNFQMVYPNVWRPVQKYWAGVAEQHLIISAHFQKIWYLNEVCRHFTYEWFQVVIFTPYAMLHALYAFVPWALCPYIFPLLAVKTWYFYTCWISFYRGVFYYEYRGWSCPGILQGWARGIRKDREDRAWY